MLLDEREEDLKRGFVQIDKLYSLMLVNEGDKNHFLRAKGFSEQEQPFYQYYDEEGFLQLDFYYDFTQRKGVGIFYELDQGQKKMSGLEVSSWNMGTWKDNKFSVKKREEDDSASEEYEEKYIYNEQGQLDYFCSEGFISGLKEPVKDKIIEIQFSYREDGTLQKKKCYYNSWQFGSTGQSEINYYDEQERLVYVDSYITHGYLESYYIYEGDDKEPSYCLILDHNGGNAAEMGFTKFGE